MNLYTRLESCPEVYRVNVCDATDAALMKINEELALALNLDEMRRIKEHFLAKGRNPTDVELQSIAQAWSEHCCYKSSKLILKKFIFGIEAPQNVLVVVEDAGVVAFDDEHVYVVGFESHNHPSALEPYGGAATGVGGIIRDVVCMGAQPVALIDALFFGPLDYDYEKLPEGVKHPRFLFDGVVAGIRDYGNRIGIPTCAGMLFFDEGYMGNCLVNVGCVGVASKKNVRRSVARPGELLVLVGGRTGRDGIHGVTFASTELTGDEALRSAVQLGDPIMKEPLMHAILDANAAGLINGMKDLGGGGLSCVVSEMCAAGNCGAVVFLDRVPLKEASLKPWEIWVSESQERFMLAVAPENLEELSSFFEKWDVPLTVVGETIKEKVIRLFYKDVKVFEMETDFLVGSVVYKRHCEFRQDEIKRMEQDPKLKEPKDYTEILLSLLASPNIASREHVVRQYDHDVRASTIIKPLHGIIGKETHGDAVVIKPLEESWRGLAITADVNPAYTRINPFWGAASAVDEVCRNLVAVGALPHSLADCLNFGNPEKPDRMGDFYECCRGLGYVARALRLPFVSGNVSFYNEFVALDRPIPPTPTVLGIGIVEDVRKCVSVDAKRARNVIYIIGETKKELGGSEYYRLRGVRFERGEKCGVVPRTNPETLRKRIGVLRRLILEGLVESCHDVSEGGLAVAACEMLFGGCLGVELDVSPLRMERSDFKLFSESNTRWLVEVRPEKQSEFEDILRRENVYFRELGVLRSEPVILIRNGSGELVDMPLEAARAAWRSALERQRVRHDIDSL
ncbi:MAG: phosphoribosylformylglycinamidine synthase subunit PurL [Candidatus Alkanophagales archaeon]|nr:MAG: phosphoribosylformylglycinamidine synthase subunit PurL [Candidatus Alkanophagales archaeon]